MGGRRAKRLIFILSDIIVRLDLSSEVARAG